MIKKIIATVLCGALTVASWLTLSGCGSKHNFTTLIVAPDCIDRGYTLHICEDCGYEYADEFTEPYGHAYEVSVYVPIAGSVSSAQNMRESSKEDDFMRYVNIINADLERIRAEEERFHIHSSCAFCDSDDFFSVDKGEVVWYSIDGGVLQPHYERGTLEDISKMLFGNMPRVCTISGRDDNGIKTAICADDFANDKYCGFYNTIVMPDTIETIGEEAFKKLCDVRRIELSNSLISIGKKAFYSMERLETLIIPESLQKIDSNAFYIDCDYLHIYYMGSEEDWNKIEIVDASASFLYAPKYYYSATPIEDGKHWHYQDGEPTVW